MMAAGPAATLEFCVQLCSGEDDQAGHVSVVLAAAVAVARLRPRPEPTLPEEGHLEPEKPTASHWYDEPLSVTNRHRSSAGTRKKAWLIRTRR